MFAPTAQAVQQQAPASQAGGASGSGGAVLSSKWQPAPMLPMLLPMLLPAGAGSVLATPVGAPAAASGGAATEHAAALPYDADAPTAAAAGAALRGPARTAEGDDGCDDPNPVRRKLSP